VKLLCPHISSAIMSCKVTTQNAPVRIIDTATLTQQRYPRLSFSGGLHRHHLWSAQSWSRLLIPAQSLNQAGNNLLSLTYGPVSRPPLLCSHIVAFSCTWPLQRSQFRGPQSEGNSWYIDALSFSDGWTAAKMEDCCCTHLTWGWNEAIIDNMRESKSNRR
jgi:hypothetical protein